MSNISEIGISSLLANQYALTVISQNIANANTPSYSRRMTDFVENAFNHGVSAGDARRIVDETANQNAQISQSNFSKASLYLQQLKNLEPSFDEYATSLTKYITDSLSALERANTDVTSTQNRGLYLSALGGVGTRFQSLSNELNQEIQNTNLSLQNNMGQINNLLSGIANVNDQLVGISQNNAELLDKRQALVNQLAQYFNFTTQLDSEGMLSVNLVNGMSLVTGRQALELNTLTDPQDPTGLLIAAKSSATNMPITSFISGGELAALLNYRTQILLPTQKSLDRLSLAMADNFNKQNALGMDANGNLGGNIFNDINNANLVTNRVIRNSNNTGSGTFGVNITDTNKLATSDYKLTIGAANAYVLTRMSDNASMGTGTISGTLPYTITAPDGFTIDITSGTFNAGDQYVVSPTRAGANNFNLISTDPSRLALGWPVDVSVGTQSQSSTGKIKVMDITDTTTTAFTATAKQLSPPVMIRFLSSTSYELINTTTSAVMEGPLTYDPATGKNIFPTAGSYDPGYRINLSGTMQAGDTFNIRYNTNSGDNNNGLALAKLYQQSIVENGKFTMTQAYLTLTNDISIETNKAQSNYDVTNALKSQADLRRDQVSGVSLPEETMQLAQYQQSYQASAQILQVAKSIFDTIMAMARG